MFEKHHFKEKEIIEHEQEIPAGEKTWNFSFTLDKDLRSSLIGLWFLIRLTGLTLNYPGESSGSTKYFVETSVDLPGFDKTESKLFHVNHYRSRTEQQVFFNM